MKILISIYSLHRGGAERVVSRLSQEWAKDHEVIIALSDTSDMVYPYGGRIVDMKCAAQTPGGKVWAIGKRVGVMRSIIEKESPERIITFMEGTTLPTFFACRSLGVLHKLTISVRNNPSVFHPLYRLCIRMVYLFIRDIVAASDGIRNALIQDFHLIPESIRTIPNPIDLKEIEEKTKERCALPDVSCCTIIAAGRLIPQKGFDTLIRAYASVRKDKSMCDTNLIILGEGKERANLEALVREYGLEEHVTLPGDVENPFACFARAGVFVLSSRMEGMPNVLLEAMASGVPVVSTDCPYGPADVITHGKNGLLTPVDDVQTLANAIKNIMTLDKEARAAYVQAAQKTVGMRNSRDIASLWFG